MESQTPYNELARNSRVSDNSWRVSEAFTRWSSNFGLFDAVSELNVSAIAFPIVKACGKNSNRIRRQNGVLKHAILASISR